MPKGDWWLGFLFILFLFSLIVLSGFEKEDRKKIISTKARLGYSLEESQEIPASLTRALESKAPLEKEHNLKLTDYFPMEVGRLFVYEADLPTKSRAVDYKVRLVPSKNGFERQEKWDLISSPKGPESSEKPRLVLKIEENLPPEEDNAQLVGFSFREGVEVKVVRDDIGFYSKAQRVFWVRLENLETIAEIIIYKDTLETGGEPKEAKARPETIRLPARPVISRRILCFLSTEEKSVSFGDQENDKLTLKKSVREDGKIKSLVYERQVIPEKWDVFGPTNGSIKEESVFKAKIGLVTRSQWISGENTFKLTMRYSQ